MGRVALPEDHEQRRALADEVHARPAAAVEAPAAVSCLALFDADADVVFAKLCEIAVLHAAETPRAGAAHAIVELGGGRIKWERHGEFTSLIVVRQLPEAALEELDDFPSAFAMLPDGWLASLPGRVMASADIVVLPTGASEPSLSHVTKWFLVDAMAGSRVLDAAGWVFTDFVLRSNGRTRWMVLDTHLGRAQTGRVVQRIIEIEIYRMMALLAFPVAREMFGRLRRMEQQLAAVTAQMAEQSGAETAKTPEVEERALLDELTRIAAEVERSVASTMFRFSAALAYWEIVRARVTEFREQRIGDMRTLSGFLSRRLAPAMSSVESASRRQEELSNRIERASALLRTRVDIAREEQNLRLLEGMNRRGKLQLRLQETVEGLSIAAITYYMVSLVSYGLKPVKTVLPWVSPEWISAASIPVIAFALWRAMQRIRAGFHED